MNRMLKICIALALVVTAGAALATSTRVWRLTSYKDFDEGETDGVLLSSFGEAQTGFGATRVDLPAAQVFSSVTAPDGTVYLGTGDQAEIWAWDAQPQKGAAKAQSATGAEPRKLCRLDAVLVSALAAGPDGTIYAGTVPGGKIYEVHPGDKEPCKELVKLEGADQTWSLLLDAAKKTLYAGTGPSGKLYAVDLATKKSRVMWESGERHLLSLARGADGALIAGTGDEAILYRVADDGTARAIHDFAGDEVRSIVRAGDMLYVAVNEFERKPAAAAASTATAAKPHGTKIVLPGTAIPVAGTLPPGRDRKGKGAIFRIDGEGRIEQLHALADGYFTALHVDATGNVYAAAGANGRVYLIRPDRTILTAFNFPERQILTLALDGAHPLIGTGDAGAIYSIDLTTPKNALYYSKVLDAGWSARFGALRYNTSGTVTVDTRSGNTARPDKSWSDWQAPTAAKKSGPAARELTQGKVASPTGRYLQLRAKFGKDAHLFDTAVHYLVQNQRARITELTVGEDAPSQVARGAKVAGKPRTPVVKVRWKVESVDDDDLVFRLYYRDEADPSGNAGWKMIGGPDPITAREHDWNTELIPDGSYLVKVVASDERSNPKDEALEVEYITTPYLVDNRKPELANLAVAGGALSGLARDAASAIVDLAVAWDGGDFTAVTPKDRVLDEQTEEFSIKLPEGLTPGSHSVAVRATDSADNIGTAVLSFRLDARSK